MIAMTVRRRWYTASGRVSYADLFGWTSATVFPSFRLVFASQLDIELKCSGGREGIRGEGSQASLDFKVGEEGEDQRSVLQECLRPRLDASPSRTLLQCRRREVPHHLHTIAVELFFRRLVKLITFHWLMIIRRPIMWRVCTELSFQFTPVASN